MSMHTLTAKLYNKPTRSPFAPSVVSEVSENFFSIYNTERRISELEYLGYKEIKLTLSDGTIHSQSE